MTRVFVYGTLKRGGSNHGFLDGQRYVGDARTTPGVVLYAVADYPGMVRSADGTGIVTGEVWEVDDACLQRLDALEGIDQRLYVREPIALEAPFASQPVETYFYLRSIDGLTPIGPTWVG
jgi:gamma-glutamylaminecyclotransferase